MPATLNYPGVYIEEVPSGVRTIIGVATSITAFIGRAIDGPQDEPVTIHNFGDFEREFGGLGIGYPMSYAVRDFFLNGGSHAIVVRLKPAAAGQPTRAKADANGLKLEAVSEGSQGNTLRARVDHDVPTGKDTWFNLTVRDSATGKAEMHRNLNVEAADDTRVDKVLEKDSTLVRVQKKADGNPDLPAQRPTAHAAVTNPEAIWSDNNFSSPFSPGSDGNGLVDNDYGSEGSKKGLFALEKADLFNLLCIPPDDRNGDVPPAVLSKALAYCQKRRAVLIVDSPNGWDSVRKALDGLDGLGLTGEVARNAALYFPRIVQSDPLQDGKSDTFAPCGVVAGVLARTDATRGVWKAPAGIDAALQGALALSVKLTDDENGELNPRGINCLRSFPVFGRVVWGARTLRGDDQLADEYKYLPVRRLALFIEESLYRGTQWVVFEPNDEPLWSQIRLNVGAFMQNLFRQGAFQGSSPRDAYFVKVDSETTTQDDINRGIVNILVGFAPLKPAEFVVIKIQQIAGQVET
jgi:phage tail sheath protein FI